jgi:Na+/H+ antiporter NhaD/arsenite permease-like protein
VSFAGHFLEAVPPVGPGLVATRVLAPGLTRCRLVSVAHIALHDAARSDAMPDEGVPLDPWQTIDGLSVALTIGACIVFAPWPGGVVAPTGAGVLPTGRPLHSLQMLGLIDWELPVLFMGLSVLSHGLQKTGLPERLVADLAAAGMPLQHIGPLSAATFLLSDTSSPTRPQ